MEVILSQDRCLKAKNKVRINFKRWEEGKKRKCTQPFCSILEGCVTKGISFALYNFYDSCKWLNMWFLTEIMNV